MGDGPGEGFGTVVGREEAVAPAAGPEDQELDSVINGNDLLDEDDDLIEVEDSDDDLADEAEEVEGADEDLADEAMKTMKMTRKTI